MLWEKPLLCWDTMGEEKDDGSIIVASCDSFDSDQVKL